MQKFCSPLTALTPLYSNQMHTAAFILFSVFSAQEKTISVKIWERPLSWYMAQKSLSEGMLPWLKCDQHCIGGRS